MNVKICLEGGGKTFKSPKSSAQCRSKRRHTRPCYRTFFFTLRIHTFLMEYLSCGASRSFNKFMRFSWLTGLSGSNIFRNRNWLTNLHTGFVHLAGQYSPLRTFAVWYFYFPCNTQCKLHGKSKKRKRRFHANLNNSTFKKND